MQQVDRNLRLIIGGWAVFVLMAVLVIAVRGRDHVANMLVFVVIALAMGIWVAWRRSRAAVVTSLVLGGLHTLQQTAYLLAGITGDDVDAAEVAVDVVGLISGLILVVGAMRAVAASRGQPVDAAR
jgi:hypothetical protein